MEHGNLFLNRGGHFYKDKPIGLAIVDAQTGWRFAPSVSASLGATGFFTAQVWKPTILGSTQYVDIEAAPILWIGTGLLLGRTGATGKEEDRAEE